ncbi:MAG: DUF1801 domain-containing protein [Bacteroidetes bacterium]|nr:DUF1801 domain-containing protein [Bacteroidota bacterium]
MENEKKKMQNVSFRSVGELLRFLPENQLLVVEKLRELVFECIPEVEERLSFNVPFYRRFRAICFIWPGAVSWGSTIWEGVEFGFNYGNLLIDEAGFLEKGNRKQVYSRRYFSPEEINVDLLRAYIFEAVEVDEMMQMEKSKRAKSKLRK